MWVGGEFMEYVHWWMVACESLTQPLCSTGLWSNLLTAYVQSVNKLNWNVSPRSAPFLSNRLIQFNGGMFPLLGFKMQKKRRHQAVTCQGFPMLMWMSWRWLSPSMRPLLLMTTGYRTPCKRFNDPQNPLAQLEQSRYGVGNCDAPAAGQRAQCQRM